MGRLTEAEELIHATLKTAKEKDFLWAPQIGGLWVLLGELMRERGSLGEAERCLERGLAVGKVHKPMLGWNNLYKIALLFSQQKFDDALICIREIETINRETNLPYIIMLAATTWQARILVVLEEWEKARELFSCAQLNEDNLVQIVQGKGVLTYTGILMKENKDDKARKLLNRAAELALNGQDQKTHIELLLLKACLEEKTGNSAAAEQCLCTALETGFECGYFQVFLDEGKDTAPVFYRLLDQKDKSTEITLSGELLQYARRVYQAISPDAGQESFKEEPLKLASSPIPGLVEELSTRELEILDLINRGLSNQEISEKLFLSVGTVKWHTSNIYGKLGVKGRTQAIAMARKLNMLPS